MCLIVLVVFSLIFKPTTSAVAFALRKDSLIPFHFGLGVYIHPCAVISTWTSRTYSPYNDLVFSTQQHYNPQFIRDLQADYLWDARRDIDYVGARKSLVLYGVRPAPMTLGLFRGIIANRSDHPMQDCFVVLPRRPYNIDSGISMEVDGLFISKVIKIDQTNDPNIVNVHFDRPLYQSECPVDDGAPLICDFIVVGLLRATYEDRDLTQEADSISHYYLNLFGPVGTPQKTIKQYHLLHTQFNDIYNMVVDMVSHSDYCSSYTPEEILSLH